MLDRDALDQIDTDTDEITQELQQAASLLSKAASDKQNRTAILRDVEGVLGKIQIKDFPELLESPAVKVFLKLMGQGDLTPGETKNKGTLAERRRDWTMGDIHSKVISGEFKLHKFVPAKSLPLTFQNVTINVIEGEACELPDCFYDIYKDHIAALKRAEHHVQFLLGQRDDPPDRGYINPEDSAYVRAFSKLGRGGGVSGTLTSGRILTEE